MSTRPNDFDIAASINVADKLFRQLAELTAGKIGIERATYGKGEQIAHDVAEALAKSWGMETRIDDMGNLYMTLPGKDRSRPTWMVGSHLDSVPAGGNYDGAAGVVAGLVAAHALITNKIQLPMDLTILAMRAEEASSWFTGPHKSHFGSRAMFGQLSKEEMAAAVSRREGRTLAEIIKAAGFYPEKAGTGIFLQDVRTVQGFIELHIEQGPVLIENDLSVAVITGIRGNLRARSCQVLGEYAHSGAVPMEYRHDAMFAAAEFAYRLEQQWRAWLKEGRDAVCTIGIFSTDPEHHSLSKVPGAVRFVIDFRSIEQSLLTEAAAFMEGLAAEIGARRGVTIDLGSFSSTRPTTLSEELLTGLEDAAAQIDVPTLRMASGGGHDAVSFREAGIPAAMLFVRNQNGSHNPHEAMEISDFADGARVILAFLLRQA